MTNIVYRKDLFAAFSDVEAKFDQAKKDISNRERVFFAALKKLQTSQKSVSQFCDSSNLLDNNPIIAKMNEYIEIISSQQQRWSEGVEQYQRGTDFRNGFDDSFLVFVYGAVKAGKSSLGNYVAYGISDPNETDIRSNEQLKFEVHAQTTGEGDEEKEAEIKKRFKVGGLETTNSIQSFTVPGLTWVDSPGLRSTKGEHGALARQYVASADLIIYVMQSHAPGRRSDLEEIASLLDKRKNILILLTGSDLTETDEDENGNIIEELAMKPLVDRELQIVYVDKEIKEDLDGLANKLIVSDINAISVKYAQAFPNDPVKFVDSGMAAVFKNMVDLAYGDSVKIKAETPLNNLRIFGEDLQKSTTVLLRQLSEIAASVRKEHEELNVQEKFSVSAVQRSMRAEISPAIEKFRGDSVALSTHLTARFKAIVTEQIVDEVKKFVDRMDAGVIQNIDLSKIKELPGFQNKMKSVLVSDVAKKKAIGSGAGALAGGWAGGQAGAIIGSPAGPVGIFIGGVVGGLFGAFFGGKSVGGMASHLAKDEVYQLKIGDNIDEIEKKAHEVYEKLASDVLAKVFDDQLRAHLVVMDEFIQKNQESLLVFSRTIQEKVTP